jgi:hypothetical protein
MPILSIIIPTHERFRYAKETVTTILAMGSDVELIVCDTSAKNYWDSFAQNPLLKIIRPETGISVVDNFNIASRHATGEYLCFIGDDDLVARDIVEIARHALNSGLDAIRFTFPIDYYWPDYLHRNNPEAYSGTIWIRKYSGRVRALNTILTLKDAAAKLGHGVFDMPRAYCGLISRSMLQRILAKHGELFGGVSPDIYSAALIAMHAKKAVEIDFPGVILGASGASTAGQSAAGRHVGDLRDNAHIRPFKELVWHKLVPEFYSVPTVWGYSLVRALENCPESLEVRPHWGRLYVQCLLYHRQYWRFTIHAMRNYVRVESLPALCATMVNGIFWEVAWALGRMRRRLSVRFSVVQDRRVGGVSSCAGAAAITEEVIASGPKPVWLEA